MMLSGEERSDVHRRLNRIIEDGDPGSVFSVMTVLIEYEHLVLLQTTPPGWLWRREALMRENERIYQRYKKCKAGTHLQLVRGKGGEVDHAAH